MKAMHSIFFLTFKIKQTFCEWLLYYPSAISHQCTGENPVMMSLYLTCCVFFLLHTWDSGLWPVSLSALMRLDCSEKLSLYQALRLAYHGITCGFYCPKVCVTSCLMIF